MANNIDWLRVDSAYHNYKNQRSFVYTINQISSIISANWVQKKQDAIVEHLLTDSRKLLFPNATIFFALNTGSKSGQAFIEELYEKGVRQFVVDHNFSFRANYPEANILQVKNVLEALQILAAHHRSQFNNLPHGAQFPVIGITGSNGKTMVKEWLYQLLQYDHNIVRSPKSYNSQIGVPLSVWQMNSFHNLAIFEAGISQRGEMERLHRIIKPTIGIVTNIGEAHNEGFENNVEKIKEKLKLFSKDTDLLYPGNHQVIKEAAVDFPGKKFEWSSAENAWLQILKIERHERHSDIKVKTQQRAFTFRILFTDEASVENAMACCAVLLYLKMDVAIIQERMQQLQPVEMRLQLKQGINNCSVINDSYSADVNSLSIALDFLLQQQQHPKRTVILSDIIGSGKTGSELYAGIGKILEQKNIGRLIAVGNEISKEQHAFTAIPEKSFFPTTEAFIKNFYSIHFANETILVKGARIFKFEQVIHLLQQKVHQTFLEVNLTAIAHNLKWYQQQLNPGTKMMAMVKASGYGSGSFEIANLLQFHKVDYLAVAYADEAVELRKAGIRLPIMVMNAEDATFDSLVQHNLEPEIYSFRILQDFQNYLQGSGIIHYPVHIKLDTGMHRLGFEESEMADLSARFAGNNIFKVQSVFSHLAASDATDHDGFTLQQATTFLKCCDEFESALGYSFIRHIANTSAISRHKELQLDMVRLGIGLYGTDSNTVVQQQLKNVATLKTTIAQIKKVAAGQTVGYSRKGILTKDALIATVRIGYADGYPRTLSNGLGTMLVKGQLAKVVGNVCMDMTMLDVSAISGVQEADEVIVFGPGQPVSVVAEQAGTISYEILTGISQRVQRVYYEE